MKEQWRNQFTYCCKFPSKYGGCSDYDSCRNKEKEKACIIWNMLYKYNRHISRILDVLVKTAKLENCAQHVCTIHFVCF